MCGSAEVEEKTDNKLTMGDAYIARSLPDLLNDCHRFPPFFVDFLARGESEFDLSPPPRARIRGSSQSPSAFASLSVVL